MLNGFENELFGIKSMRLALLTSAGRLCGFETLTMGNHEFLNAARIVSPLLKKLHGGVRRWFLSDLFIK
jgi:hypothetical protein